MFDFPNTPANGATALNSGITYRWDGVKWVSVNTGGPTVVTSFNTRTGAVVLGASDVSAASGLLTTGGTMTGPLNMNADITMQGGPTPPAGGAYTHSLYVPTMTLPTGSNLEWNGYINPGGTAYLSLAGGPAATMGFGSGNIYTSTFSAAAAPGSPTTVTARTILGGGALTMDTGTSLILAHDPAQPLEAVTLQYYNAHLSSGPAPASTLPLVEGTAAIGTSLAYARADHVHPQFGAGGGATITISDTPPASPTSGAMWFDSVGAQTYIWYPDPNSAAWVPMNAPPSAATASFLPLTGGTLTGALTLPGNAASGLQAAPLQQVVAKAGDTMTGNLNLVSLVASGAVTASQGIIANNNGTIVVDGATQQNRGLMFRTNGNTRWWITLTTEAEGGSNNGTNLEIDRYADGGGYLGTAVSINRNSGLVTFVPGITVNGNVGNPTCYPLNDNVGHCGGAAYRWQGVWSTTGSIQTSDPKEKRDIRPLPDDCLDIVDAVQPVRFRWKEGDPDDDVTHWGFLATEIRDIMDQRRLDFGGVIVPEKGPVALQPTELLAVLWRGVQQLSAEVAALRAARV